MSKVTYLGFKPRHSSSTMVLTLHFLLPVPKSQRVPSCLLFCLHPSATAFWGLCHCHQNYCISLPTCLTAYWLPPFDSFSELYWNDCSKMQSDRHCFAKNPWLAPCSLVVPWCPGVQGTHTACCDKAPHIATSSPEVLRFYTSHSYLQGLLTQGLLSPTPGVA